MVKTNRIGAVIQARLDSTRLPNKVLLPLPFGTKETLLSQIVRRLKGILELDEIIIATSTDPNDDPIFQEAENLGVSCYRGDKHNVLSRFTGVAKKFNLDTLIRITGDNPIVLIDKISIVLKKHIEGDYEYSRNKGLITGASFEIIDAKVLLSIESEATKQEHLEHVTFYLKENPKKFNILVHNHTCSNSIQDARLTVDYASDYAMMNILFQVLAAENYFYNLKKLESIFVRYPWLKVINQGNFQKRQFVEVKDELIETSKISKFYSLQKAKLLLDEKINSTI
jgi:spore coat polysaccharide biosynthesis protein SpsF